MGKILVFAEHQGGHLKRSAQELFTAAKSSGQAFDAVILGAQASKLAVEAGNWGANEAHIFEGADYEKYNPELFANALSDVIQKSGATLILASASSTGRDLFPRVAARLDAGIVSDCTELKIEGSQATVRKPLYAGKCFATMGFEGAAIQMVLMRPNQLPVGTVGAGTAKLVAHTASSSGLKTLIRDVVKGTSEKLDLTEANIIVSGGRGMKEAGNFKLLQDLADVLGATVGASRAVVDAGWVPHDMQVGQTGKTVAPTLYIAVGISGAIQHLAGMSGSKVIVAVNTDSAAPIFQKATYGIVGDFADVVPKLTEEFRRVLR